MRERVFEHGVIYEGDCLKKMQDIPDGSIDMILADLPYGSTACRWDVVIPFEPLWKEYKRLIKNNGVIALTGTQPFSSLMLISNLSMFKYEIIWQKTRPVGHLVAYKRIMSIHENILIFYDGQCTYHPQYTQRCDKDIRINRVKNKEKNPKIWKTELVKNCPDGKYSDKYDEFTVSPKSILVFSNVISNDIRVHPTQKPVMLFEYLIKTYTNEGDTVLDNVIGSGTTAVAAFRTGRKWIGIEKDSEMFEKACHRIERDTQQQTIFSMDAMRSNKVL